MKQWTANDGMFSRDINLTKITNYCVSVYYLTEEFDQLPKHNEKPYYCDSQEAAVAFLATHMQKHLGCYNYVIRKLTVVHQ